ncbi:SPOR domain-containing protein [Rivibacter subsaxonicus]|uniref:DedD protein n=1 Tax=Rivibacter subsaxonicus TaxID=457575 RepID=A0A4Q7VP05_9BURK|nr:SPOR domain-containing protein [Rivibacter subsaxonicus]RZT98130.1 DedD protein [Rivibacter subsaxonicus]
MGLLSFFKRKPATDQGSAEDVQRARTRARQRLIGAAVLVALAVIGLPLLLDTAPRPVAADLPIEIPRKEAVPPLVAPNATAPRAATPAARATASAPSAGADDAAVAKAAAARAELPPESREVAPSPPKPAAKDEPKPAAKPVVKDEPKAAAKPAPSSDGARAASLLAGNEVAAGEGRYVVQVGAFAESAGAREARAKVEKLGLKTYTQVVETKEGKRIRVRVGPYAARADADKAAAQLRASGLGAAVLTL